MNESYHFEKLGHLEPEVDSEDICVVGDRSDEPVVVGEQVIVEPLRLGICLHRLHATLCNNTETFFSPLI